MPATNDDADGELIDRIAALGASVNAAREHPDPAVRAEATGDVERLVDELKHER